MCFSPVGDAFRDRLRRFPSLVTCTTIDWFTAWPDDALRSVAAQALAGLRFAPAPDVAATAGPDGATAATPATAAELEALDTAGGAGLQGQTGEDEQEEKKQEEVAEEEERRARAKDDALRAALAQQCMELHRYTRKLGERYAREVRRHTYVTPTSFLQLLDSFSLLLTRRQDEVAARHRRYSVGLEKLLHTESQVTGGVHGAVGLEG